MNWTEQDIDSLLVSVEETIAKADVLAKSSLAKAGEDDQADDQAAAAAQDSAQAAPADAAPAQAAPEAAAADPASADAAAADQGAPADAAAADAGAAPGAEGDQALEGEEEAPLSDEELAQIYGSMAPDELERHYSVIRQQLQAAYSQDQGQAAPDAAAEQAPEAAAPAAAPAAPGAEEMMGKSEEIADLKKQVAELAAANQQIVKAFEVLAKPSRKSITDIQFMAKSEADAGASQDNSQKGPMTVAQVKDAVSKIAPAKLEKSERDMVNKFYLSGEGKEEVEKLIHSKGGK